MATFHDLRLRRRELLDELEELEEAVAELTAILHEAVDIDDEQRIEHHERLVWLQRQQAGALVVLSETERVLLTFGTDGWDDE
jgi:response regulator RpfG family c-di-GMP phosphodiesterase